MHQVMHPDALLPAACFLRCAAAPHARTRPGDELPDSCKLYVGNLSQARAAHSGIAHLVTMLRSRAPMYVGWSCNVLPALAPTTGRQ